MLCDNGSTTSEYSTVLEFSHCEHHLGFLLNDFEAAMHLSMEIFLILMLISEVGDWMRRSESQSNPSMSWPGELYEHFCRCHWKDISMSSSSSQ